MNFQERLVQRIPLGTVQRSVEALTAFGKAYEVEAKEWSVCNSFVRRVLETKELTTGRLPVFKVPEGAKEALYLVSPSKSGSATIRDTMFMPPEIVWESKPYIEKMVIDTSVSDLIEETVNEVNEGMTVCAERQMVSMMKSVPPIEVSNFGEFDRLELTMSSVTGPIASVMLGSAVFSRLKEDERFLKNFRTTIDKRFYGKEIEVLTDATRHPTLKCLGAQDIIVTSTPSRVGGLTERRWDSYPLNGVSTSRPGFGVWVFTSVSMILFTGGWAWSK